uniref:Ig-like domain-containing protein n=1 Tax=Sinocyclocheilus rhinocerous TaxID=307959 RepID=A0A673NQT7_9TELE
MKCCSFKWQVKNEEIKFKHSEVAFQILFKTIIFICTSVHIVLQSTRFISALPGDKVTFDCSMAAGVSVSSYTMHWYRQDHYGQPIQYSQNIRVKTCARALAFGVLGKFVSAHVCCDTGLSQAYFGNGTKLTVLAANVTLPKVKILPPSPKEICSQDKINDKRSTLVCVASGFYPDHVSVSWKVNGVARQDSVSTDTSAQQDKTTLMYHISSRIKVNDTDWMDLKSSFACTVQFFNGDEYVNVTNTINGQKGL